MPLRNLLCYNCLLQNSLICIIHTIFDDFFRNSMPTLSCRYYNNWDLSLSCICKAGNHRFSSSISVLSHKIVSTVLADTSDSTNGYLFLKKHDGKFVDHIEAHGYDPRKLGKNLRMIPLFVLLSLFIIQPFPLNPPPSTSSHVDIWNWLLSRPFAGTSRFITPWHGLSRASQRTIWAHLTRCF
jgi:hypothetical protein